MPWQYVYSLQLPAFFQLTPAEARCGSLGEYRASTKETKEGKGECKLVYPVFPEINQTNSGEM